MYPFGTMAVYNDIIKVVEVAELAMDHSKKRKKNFILSGFHQIEISTQLILFADITPFCCFRPTALFTRLDIQRRTLKTNSMHRSIGLWFRNLLTASGSCNIICTTGLGLFCELEMLQFYFFPFLPSSQGVDFLLTMD
jgi:hypothetical protein